MLEVPNMVMIGGNARNAGKTTLACKIISRLAPGHKIIALKVTGIKPGEEDFHGEHTEELTTGFAIFEEHNPDSPKDTSKMLRAGATHVYYLRVADTDMEQAILHFLSGYVHNELIVCESRSLRMIVKPGLFVMMLKNTEAVGQKEVGFYLEKADYIFDFVSQQDKIQKFIDHLHVSHGVVS